jgi:hypothetical protein
MAGYRKCAGCKKERAEFYRKGEPRCRVWVREAKQRAAAQVYRVARGVIAAPRKQWAKELIARLL